MITLISFGYRYGVPLADRVYDLRRRLKNPYYQERLQDLTGLDGPVRDFVRRDDGSKAVLFEALQDCQSNMTLAFGCYGGRHRSVALVEWVADLLRESGHQVEVAHRDLYRRPT